MDFRLKSEEDLHIFMKALALNGQDTSFLVDCILKILGLDICADTPVGDKMIKRDLWWPKEAAQKFAEEFHLFSMGTNVCRELVTRFNRRNGNLSTSSNGVMKWELLKIGYSWLKLLMKQNSFIYIFKFIKLLLVASITMTVFFRTKMHHKTVDDGSLYLSSLYFSMVIIFFNGFTEVSMLVLLPLLGLYTSILGIEYSNFSL
ncbi:hypothetical protein RND81_05G033700 [Saponaria officinalis]|uniref:Uncharacterized protein n=1 Tax=Saponaria officinalis TaxID=3572 RepID=A0AAW1KTB3_SAPOF